MNQLMQMQYEPSNLEVFMFIVIAGLTLGLLAMGILMLWKYYTK